MEQPKGFFMPGKEKLVYKLKEISLWIEAIP